MRLLMIMILLPLLTTAQQYVRNEGETPEQFVKRIAPPAAHTVKYLLTDKFNTADEKIAYAYTVFEEGNIVNNADSTLTYYACILIPDSADVMHYSEQKFKMVASYKKRTRIENAEIILVGKEKRLQIYVSELVRGPGGLPRDVKRTFVYGQKNFNRHYNDTFIEIRTAN